MNRASVFPLILVALLAGCAPTPPAPAPTSSPAAEAPSATPSPTVEPVVLTEPQPLLDISCDEIAPGETFASLTADPLKAAGREAFVAGEFAYGIPFSYTLQQLQSSECLWQNEAPKYDENGSSDEYVSLRVTALPNGAEAWGVYKKLYGTTKGFVGTSCNGADRPTAYCHSNGLLANGTWLEVTFDGMKHVGSDSKNVAKFSKLVAHISSALESAGTTQPWRAPDETYEIETSCPSLLTADDVASAVGGKASDVTFNDDRIGGTSLVFEAERLLHSEACRWFTESAPSEYGTPYRILRGGEWAWLSARETTEQFIEAENIALDGLIEGDSAWLRKDGSVLTADIIVGHNWIAIDVYEESFASRAQAKAALLKLAQSSLDQTYEG
jgi:hypothetical protein